MGITSGGISVSEAVSGALIGGAIGDALGLPYEGLTARRAAKLLGPPDRYRLAANKGFVSDDTEHAAMTAEALCRSGGDPKQFELHLAHLLRQWILCLPAGVGLATLSASLKLLLGVPTHYSGIQSAGNGPAMRAAVLGASVPALRQLPELVRRSTRLTHTDPKAEYAALAVAVAAYCQRNGRARDFESELSALLPQDEAAQDLLNRLRVPQQHPKGVSGYAYHTVPTALWLWRKHQRALVPALQEAVLLGGDTDTLAAIVGGVIGAGGLAPMPSYWTEQLSDPTFHPAALHDWGLRVEAAMQGQVSRHPKAFLAKRFGRNFIFVTLVLWHGLRRLGPPY